MRTRSVQIRAICGVLLAMMLAVRLLAPAGFMPAFDRGAVTIVACPDADPAVPPADAHHHGHSKALHQTCPYAAASGLGALAAGFGSLGAVIFLAAALALAGGFLLIERNGRRERPPARGPPIPA